MMASELFYAGYIILATINYPAGFNIVVFHTPTCMYHGNVLINLDGLHTKILLSCVLIAS